MNNEEFQTIRTQMATDGARAAVDFADRLLAYSLEDVERVKEARQWIGAALAIDKAAADGQIAEMAAKLDRKMRKRAAAEEMEGLDRASAVGDNVVTMPSREDR